MKYAAARGSDHHSPTPAEARRTYQVKQRSVVLLTMTFVDQRVYWLIRRRDGDHPNRLDAILYEDRSELTRARITEDERLIAVVDKHDDAALANLHSYKTTSGMPQSQVRSDILLHLFNHQTHHRGQAHACLSILTGDEPSSLDLLVFQRGGISDASLRRGDQ